MRTIRLRVGADGVPAVSLPFGVALSEVERIVSSRADWIRQQQAQLEGSPRSVAEHATDEEKREWRSLVELAVPVLLEKWEPVMGVRVKKLAFRNMKSRWGSCQPATGRVCINTRLALYPPQCLEYVVVHELCHLLEPSHNARFKGLLSSFLPNWREAERPLRE